MQTQVSTKQIGRISKLTGLSEQEKIRQVSEETGIPEPEVLDRALDMLLLTEEMHGLRALKDDMGFWQQRYLDTLALEDERMTKLDYDEGRDMGH